MGSVLALVGSFGKIGADSLQFESNEYSRLVRQIRRTATNMQLKKADDKMIADACGTESLDIIADYWEKVHKTDKKYRSFVLVNVFMAFEKIGQKIMATDNETSKTLKIDGKSSYDELLQEKIELKKQERERLRNTFVGYNPDSSNNETRIVQQLLKMSKIDGSFGTDGVFGPNTAKAVIEFQKQYGEKYGLTVCQYGMNGELVYVDNKTLAAMYAVAQDKKTTELQTIYGKQQNLDLNGNTVLHKDDWLEWASKQNGFVEISYSSDDTNRTPFGLFTGADQKPWCASFVSWCLFMSGESTIPYTASTADMKQYAIDAGIYKDLRTEDGKDYVPEAGDIFYFKTKEGGHVGFISSVVDNSDGTYTIKTLEGNSSDQVCSHEYTCAQEAFKEHWDGFIEMDREEKTSYTDNIDVTSTDDSGQTR